MRCIGAIPSIPSKMTYTAKASLLGSTTAVMPILYRKNEVSVSNTKHKNQQKFVPAASVERLGTPERSAIYMASFLKKCYQANENWRRAAYKEIVEGYGISVGAVVKVVEKSGYGSNERITTSLGIIKSINWDKANVFAALSKKSDTVRSPFVIEVLVGNRNVKLNNLKRVF